MVEISQGGEIWSYCSCKSKALAQDSTFSDGGWGFWHMPSPSQGCHPRQLRVPILPQPKNLVFRVSGKQEWQKLKPTDFWVGHDTSAPLSNSQDSLQTMNWTDCKNMAETTFLSSLPMREARCTSLCSIACSPILCIVTRSFSHQGGAHRISALAIVLECYTQHLSYEVMPGPSMLPVACSEMHREDKFHFHNLCH